MMQTISSSSNRYDGIRVKSIRKRRYDQNNSKIRPKNVEENHSKATEPKMSYASTSLTSSEIINSVVPNGSFQQSKTIPHQRVLSTSETTQRSEILTSTNKESDASTNNDKDKQLKHADQPKRCNPPWKYILKILYGILGILLLIAVILPSILVYLLAPKASQTGLSESPTYTNHCAGISPSNLWQMDNATIITMKINTTKCNFKETPLYFVSVAGSSNHYCLAGYGAIYLPTTGSFQIYTQSTCGAWNASTMLNYATLFGWDVNWMGFYK